MLFALLGDHPDGLDMTRALVESGRHRLAAYSGSAVGAETLRQWGIVFVAVGDVEEILADPAVEAVIVAGPAGVRPAQLRRALQSERHVLCVHPADAGPDVAYEAQMIQGDTGQVLLPLLPEALHPAFRRLAEVVGLRHGRSSPEAHEKEIASLPAQAASSITLLEGERSSTESVLVEADAPDGRPGVPGWNVLRLVGGEIGELSAFAAAEELLPQEPLLLAGGFLGGGLFRMTLLPRQPESRWRLTLAGAHQRAELLFPQGWPGPARLTWLDDAGRTQEESWPSWDPWPALVLVFEEAVRNQQHAEGRIPNRQAAPWALSWIDEIRSLELDDAARRSLARRRTSTLDHQIATEEASFKGAMTLVGCGLLWVSLALLILSVWVPWLGWVIAPLFGLFLLLQLFSWALPKNEPNHGSHG
jgi:hypothetical protein